MAKAQKTPFLAPAVIQNNRALPVLFGFTTSSLLNTMCNLVPQGIKYLTVIKPPGKYFFPRKCSAFLSESSDVIFYPIRAKAMRGKYIRECLTNKLFSTLFLEDGRLTW